MSFIPFCFDFSTEPLQDNQAYACIIWHLVLIVALFKDSWLWSKVREEEALVHNLRVVVEQPRDVLWSSAL